METHLDHSITALTHSLFVFSLTRAAQKLNITSRKKKKHPTPELEVPPFPTNFGGVIQLNPPPAPPCLLRPNLRLQNPALCKVGTNIFTIFLPFAVISLCRVAGLAEHFSKSLDHSTLIFHAFHVSSDSVLPSQPQSSSRTLPPPFFILTSALGRLQVPDVEAFPTDQHYSEPQIYLVVAD